MRDVSAQEFSRILTAGIAGHSNLVLDGLAEAAAVAQHEARSMLGEDHPVCEHIESATEMSGLVGVAVIGIRHAEAGERAVAQEFGTGTIAARPFLGAAGAGMAEDVAAKVAGTVLAGLFGRRG
jgi:hypothetical protein